MSENIRELDRREFLRLAAGLGVTAVAGGWVWNAFLAHDDPEAEAKNGHGGDPNAPYWVMVIDLETCIGCERCAYACQATNDTAPDHLWNIVLHDEETFDKPVFLPRPCMHCDARALRRGLPGESDLSPPGWAGRRWITSAVSAAGTAWSRVPYGVRVFNWEEREDENPMTPTWGTPEVNRRPRGVVEKCTFCSHRLDSAEERGLRPGYDDAVTPACCVICPTEARRFGDLKDPNSPAVRAMQGRQAVFLRSELGTNPRVYYLLPVT